MLSSYRVLGLWKFQHSSSSAARDHDHQRIHAPVVKGAFLPGSLPEGTLPTMSAEEGLIC